MVPPARSFLNGSTGATPSRTEAVLDAIKRAILAGELRPGQSLVETELAQLLGVSKTPVREALKTLAGAGLVTMSAYRGATVRAIDPASAAAIYDLRLLLEPEAVRRAVGRGAAEPAPSPASAVQAAGRVPTRPCRPPTPPPTRRSAAWPTASSTAPCTWPAVTACWSRPWTTCAIRPRWCPRCPGSRPPRGSRRPPSIRPSWPRRGAVRPPRRRPCSARTSPGSPTGISPLPAIAAVAPATEWSTDEH